VVIKTPPLARPPIACAIKQTRLNGKFCSVVIFLKPVLQAAYYNTRRIESMRNGQTLNKKVPWLFFTALVAQTFGRRYKETRRVSCRPNVPE
jgi:hypothetical protein